MMDDDDDDNNDENNNDNDNDSDNDNDNDNDKNNDEIECLIIVSFWNSTGVSAHSNPISHGFDISRALPVRNLFIQRVFYLVAISSADTWWYDR